MAIDYDHINRFVLQELGILRRVSDCEESLIFDYNKYLCIQ